MYVESERPALLQMPHCNVPPCIVSILPLSFCQLLSSSLQSSKTGKLCVSWLRELRGLLISRKPHDPIFTSCSSHSHLCNLPYDVLALIFQAVAERPPCALGEASKGPKPLDSLSRTNKMMRELCMPILFERITLKCR